MAKKKTTRKNVPNIKAEDPGVPCPRCRHRYNHTRTNTYANGNRRMICGGCSMPFIAVRRKGA